MKLMVIPRDKITEHAPLPHYTHDVQQGRVVCNLCGCRIFSRSPKAITLWENAHMQFCQEFYSVVPVEH